MVGDGVDNDQTPEDENVTPKWFILEKKAMVAELRLLVIASVALNQFLSNVSLPVAVGVALPLVGGLVMPVINVVLIAAVLLSMVLR